MATFFEEWLVSWDQDLKRNILLLVDNCPTHVINVKLHHIKVVFFPWGQGIIRALKMYYRTVMRRNVLRVIDAGLEDPSISCAKDVVKKISLLKVFEYTYK